MRAELKRAIRDIRKKGPFIRGLLGDFDGNIAVSGRGGYYYVRIDKPGGYEVGMFPGRVPLLYNLPVRIETHPITGVQSIAGIDDETIAYSGTDPADVATTAPHGSTHGWGGSDMLMWLHTNQLYPLRCQPHPTSDNFVVIQAGVYFAQSTFCVLADTLSVDLSGYVPAAGRKYVVVYLDAEGVAGISDTSALQLSEVVPLTTSEYMVAVVRLRATTALGWQDIVDTRFLALTSFLNLTDTPDDYTDAGGFLAVVTGGEDGLEFEEAPTTPAAGAIPRADGSGLLDDWISAAADDTPGLVELATDAETQAGTDEERAVTPHGLRADVPATPAASRGVRLDANGNVLLPSGGDVLPDGATDVDHGIDNRLRDVSGPVEVGDYGYAPEQIIVPVSDWYLGDDTTGRDDFIRDNIDPNGNAMWTVPAGCTPYSASVSAIVSWLFLQSGHAGDTYPNHAILRAALPDADNTYYARLVMGNMAQDQRVGLVLMDNGLNYGMAMWITYTHATTTVQLEGATFADAVDPWLTHANATTSSVAWTTSWTTRWTGTALQIDEYAMHGATIVECRKVSSARYFYIRSRPVGNRTLLYYNTGFSTNTMRNLYLFVAGNVASTSYRPYLRCDFVNVE